MAQLQQNLQTPPKGPRATHPILSIANNSFPPQQPLKPHLPYSQIEPFSFGASSCHREGTERKIKLVSGSPPPLPIQLQRTEKKRFIKLLSPWAKREREEEESAIADQHTPEESQEEEGQRGASLNYFQQEVGRMGEELRGIAEENIEEEQRIAMLSHKASHQQIPINNPQQNSINPPPQHSLPPSSFPPFDEVPQPPKRKIILSQKQSRPSHPSTEIKPIFRYCIGCQQPILEANVLLHESQCESFQRVFKMDYREITELLGGMVNGLTKRIDCMQQALTPRDLENLKNSLEELLRQSGMMGEGEGERASFGRSISAVERESRKWVSLAQEVCRLNWFITLRQAIRHQSSLPLHPPMHE